MGRTPCPSQREQEILKKKLEHPEAIGHLKHREKRSHQQAQGYLAEEHRPVAVQGPCSHREGSTAHHGHHHFQGNSHKEE